MSNLFGGSRKLILGAISTVVSSFLVVGLISPATAASWSDYSIPDTGKAAINSIAASLIFMLSTPEKIRTFNRQGWLERKNKSF
jgi:hypothetical protein